MPDEAMTSRNEPVDYDELMRALFNDAVGDSEDVVESSILTRTTEDGTIRQERRRQRPNIPLALKLLENRIGGPQDFC